MKKLILVPVNLSLFGDEEEKGEMTGNTELDVDIDFARPDVQEKTVNSQQSNEGGEQNAPDTDKKEKSKEGTKEDKDESTKSEDPGAGDQDPEEEYKEFKEKYKDQFSKDFQKQFDKRFKNNKELLEKVTTYDPVIQKLMKYHGVNTFEELTKKVDGELIEELAETEGLSKDEYVKREDQKFKAAEYDRITKEQGTKTEEEKQVAERVTRWRNEEADLKKTVENFTLDEEVKNPKFKEFLGKGYSVQDSYTLAHIDDIKANTAKSAEDKVLANIAAGKQRISENGTTASPSADVKKGTQFTDAKIDEIRRKVLEDEEDISF